MRSKETKIERWIENERSSKILMYHPMCHAILKKAFLLFSQESNGNSMRMIERDNSELLVEWKNYLYRNRGKIYSRVKSVYIVI